MKIRLSRTKGALVLLGVGTVLGAYYYLGCCLKPMRKPMSQAAVQMKSQGGLLGKLDKNGTRLVLGLPKIELSSDHAQYHSYLRVIQDSGRERRIEVASVACVGERLAVVDQYIQNLSNQDRNTPRNSGKLKNSLSWLVPKITPLGGRGGSTAFSPETLCTKPHQAAVRKHEVSSITKRKEGYRYRLDPSSQELEISWDLPKEDLKDSAQDSFAEIERTPWIPKGYDLDQQGVERYRVFAPKKVKTKKPMNELHEEIRWLETEPEFMNPQSVRESSRSASGA